MRPVLLAADFERDDGDGLHGFREFRCLTTGGEKRIGSPRPLAKMDLEFSTPRAHPRAFVLAPFFFRPVAACWWARTIVEVEGFCICGDNCPADGMYTCWAAAFVQGRAMTNML